MAESEVQQIQQQELQKEEEPRQYSEDESKAMEHGWVPKDQWKGETDEWVPAKVFNIRGELFGRIAKDKATINDLKQSVDALVEDRKKLFDAGYQRALDDLKRDKRVALEEGDTEAVMEIDDKIDAVKEEAQRAKEEFEKKTTPQNRPVNLDFETWHVNNEWYLKDGSLTSYANDLAEQMSRSAQASGKTIEWGKFYNEITRKVRQKFPEKFETRSRATMNTQEVDNGDSSTSDRPTIRSNTLKESDLTDDQRRIMNNILKTTKGITKKEYLEQMSLFEQRKGTR